MQKEDCNLLIYTAFGVYIIPAFIAFLLWFLIRHVTEKLIHCPRHDVRDEKKAMPRPNDLQNILVKNAAIDTGLFLTYFRFNSIHIYVVCHIIWVIWYMIYCISNIICMNFNMNPEKVSIQYVGDQWKSLWSWSISSTKIRHQRRHISLLGQPMQVSINYIT